MTKRTARLTEQKPRPADLICEIDPAELAIRLCEANYDIKRPMPDALATLDAMDDDVREAWLRSAKAVADYFCELINNGHRPS